jgi:hypothetical protein
MEKIRCSFVVRYRPTCEFFRYEGLKTGSKERDVVVSAILIANACLPTLPPAVSAVLYNPLAQGRRGHREPNVRR